MTAQLPLSLIPHPDAILIGTAAALVEDETGGRVFLHGELALAWDVDDQVCRRLAAVQLVRSKAAKAVQVAAAFGVDPDTLRRGAKALNGAGPAALVAARPGPKGPSRLTAAVIADIRGRRAAGASLRGIAAAVGVSTDSVRRALPPAAHAAANDEVPPATSATAALTQAPTVEHTAAPGDDPAPDLPVLPAPVDRDSERAAARWGQLTHAEPVFAPAARVPLAGLLLAIPALEATALLPCAATVFGCLRNGFYGLDTMLVEGVLRALAGEPRAEGATRIDPAALGRVLGLDRGPEVKTIRRKITDLAATGRADELLAAMAAAHVARLDKSNPDLLAVFYVDGHVRAYQGARKVAKTHLSRLKFPAPATVETWVSDASGDPVLVVMAARGGSPALFEHMDAQGFDVLTWRKGLADDVDPDLFTDAAYQDETGRVHQWRVADTTVDLSVGEHNQVFTMRQV